MSESTTIRKAKEKIKLTINKEFTQITIQETNTKTTTYKLNKEQSTKLKFLNFIYPNIQKLEQDLLEQYNYDIDSELDIINTLYSITRDIKTEKIVRTIYNENKFIGQYRIGE